MSGGAVALGGGVTADVHTGVGVINDTVGSGVYVRVVHISVCQVIKTCETEVVLILSLNRYIANWSTGNNALFPAYFVIVAVLFSFKRYFTGCE